MAQPLQDFKRRFSPRQRAAILALALAELGLKVAAARDIRRRADEEIRGSKLFWRLALLVNTFGPVGYFCFGRRRRAE